MLYNLPKLAETVDFFVKKYILYTENQITFEALGKAWLDRMQRTLWRTHLVVCRRCKAEAESLRQTDGDAILADHRAVLVLWGLHFHLVTI